MIALKVWDMFKFADMIESEAVMLGHSLTLSRQALMQSLGVSVRERKRENRWTKEAPIHSGQREGG